VRGSGEKNEKKDTPETCLAAHERPVDFSVHVRIRKRKLTGSLRAPRTSTRAVSHSLSLSLPLFFRDENLQLLTRSRTLLSVRETHACLLSLPSLPSPPVPSPHCHSRHAAVRFSLSPFSSRSITHNDARDDAHNSDLLALLRSFLSSHLDALARAPRVYAISIAAREIANLGGKFGKRSRESATRDGRKHVEGRDAARRDATRLVAQRRACSPSGRSLRLEVRSRASGVARSRFSVRESASWTSLRAFARNVRRDATAYRSRLTAASPPSQRPPRFDTAEDRHKKPRTGTTTLTARPASDCRAERSGDSVEWHRPVRGAVPTIVAPSAFPLLSLPPCSSPLERRPQFPPPCCCPRLLL